MKLKNVLATLFKVLTGAVLVVFALNPAAHAQTGYGGSGSGKSPPSGFGDSIPSPGNNNSNNVGGGKEIQGKAANPSGNWIWYVPGQKTGERWTNSLKLKLEVDTLTGTLSAPGKDGKCKDILIENAKLDGNHISFTTVEWLNPLDFSKGRGMTGGVPPETIEGNFFTNTYLGTVTINKITGEVHSKRGDNERVSSWRAKLQTEQK